MFAEKLRGDDEVDRDQATLLRTAAFLPRGGRGKRRAEKQMEGSLLT